MTTRRKVGQCEKENECPDPSRKANNRLNSANRRSPSHQRKEGKTERKGSSTSKRDAPREELTETFIRQGCAVDGFVQAQRPLKAKFLNVFQHCRENDEHRKDIEFQEYSGKDESIISSKPSLSTTFSPLSRRSSSSRRTPRNGSEKRNHLQVVLTELKTRVKRTSKENDFDNVLQHNMTHLSCSEMNQVRPAEKIPSDRLFPERLFLSPQVSAGAMSTWLSRPGRQQIPLAEGALGQGRRRLFRNDQSSRGSNGVLGSGEVHFPSLPQFGEDFQDQPHSFDAKMGQWGRMKARRQARRRNVPVRRTKSSSSLQTQRGSDFFWKHPDVLEELSAESAVLDNIQVLRSALERSERDLKNFIEESEKNRTELQERVSRLTTLYYSLSQSQDMRYRSLLDVFHENHKLLGYVESNFDYVLSVVARGRRTNLQGHVFGLLRFIADHTMAPILCVIRFGLKVYLRVFPRRTRPNG